MRLGDYCSKIGSGATPRGGKESYLDVGPVALIRSQNVHNDGFRREGLVYISEDQAAKLAHVSVEPQDVLINITGDSVARVCLAPSDVLPARVNQHVAIIRTRPDDIDPRYLRYFLLTPSQQQLLLGLAGGGATRKALTKGMLENLRIPKPPIEVQRRMVEPLDLIDRAISLNRRINNTLQSIAQAIFKSWFIDFDPVHAKAAGREPEGMDAETAALFPSEFEDSELGPIPKGWRLGTLGAIALNIRKQVDPEQIDAQTPYIGLEHMPRGSIALCQWGTSEGLQSGKLVFHKKDILFGRLRPYLRKVGVAPCDGVCSTDILVLRPITDDFQGILAMYVSSRELIEYSSRLSTGARMPRISWKDLAAYPIVIPPLDVARAYERTVRPLVDRILANIEQAHVLQQLRDILLPRLVSGKLRVPEVEELVQEAAS